MSNSVLGIDPGLGRTGWAVVEPGPKLLACGLISTKAGLPLGRRLEIIFEAVGEVLRGHAPGQIALEEMFFLKRASAMSSTLQARGVILLAAQLAGVETASYDPKKVKITVSGNGAADKAQMQKAVKMRLGLKENLSPDDVADAAAIALCHLQLGPLAKKIREALKK